MPEREPVREFWTLIDRLHRLRLPEWSIRRVAATSIVRLRHGKYQGRLKLIRTYSSRQSWFTVVFHHRHPKLELGFRRLMTALGYECHGARGDSWYRRKCAPSSLRMEAERELLRRTFRSGRVVAADRRTIDPVIIERGWSNGSGQGPCRKFIDWLRTGCLEGWRPALIFFRHQVAVSKAGHGWWVTCDGYWEPPDRPGLELDLLLTSRKPMSPLQWRKLTASDFMARVERRLREVGFEMYMRPRLGVGDFEGKSPGEFFTAFQSIIRRPFRNLQPLRAMLRWRP